MREPRQPGRGSISPFVSPGIARFASVFFVGTLIFCHGVFGSFHITSDPAIAPMPAEEHATTHHHSGTPHEHPETHHAEYCAVLLGTFLGGLALWLLLLNSRRYETSSALRLASSPPATFSNLPRGPTLHLLQVLRL